jgi:hypothetical protein
MKLPTLARNLLAISSLFPSLAAQVAPNTSPAIGLLPEFRAVGAPAPLISRPPHPGPPATAPAPRP